jgi:membrane fusion protein, multidrug efflux system
MTARNLFLIAIAFLISLGFLACDNSGHFDPDRNPNSSKTDEAEYDPVPVEIRTVETGSIAEYLETTGNIYADSRVVIYPKTSGQIVRINVEEGDTVTANHVLALIDDDELRLRTQQLETSRRQAQEKRDRTRELFENRMISKEAFDDASYRYDDADVAWRLARLNLENTRIKSPINGIVVSRNVRIGDLVSTATPIFEVIDPDSLQVDVFLPEKDAARLEIGMPAVILPDSLLGQSFPASVQRINPAVDPGTGTVKVTLQFDSKLDKLSAGMFVRVRIKVESRNNAVILPKRALVRQRDENHVFVINSDRQAEQRPVVLGLENMHSFEVLAGLESGETLIVVGQHSLENGQPVRWVNENDIAAPSDGEMD